MTNNFDNTNLDLEISKQVPESNTVENISNYIPNSGELFEMEKSIEKELKKLESPKGSLAELVADSSIFESFVALKKDSLSKKDKETFIAISTRLKRFRIKYYYIYNLIFHSPRKNYALTQKVENIWKQLCKEKIILDSSLAPKGLTITHEMIASFVKRNLTSLEGQLKDLLSPTAYLYDIANPHLLDFQAFPEILDPLKDVMPIGLKGWEADYYYVFSLLIDDSIAFRIFSESQYKQWATLRIEMLELLVFLRYGQVYEKIFHHFLQKSSNVMNIPYIKFIFPQPPLFKPEFKEGVIPMHKCSNETFSRFVTACSYTVIELYFLIFKHVVLALAEKNK